MFFSVRACWYFGSMKRSNSFQQESNSKSINTAFLSLNSVCWCFSVTQSIKTFSRLVNIFFFQGNNHDDTYLNIRWIQQLKFKCTISKTTTTSSFQQTIWRRWNFSRCALEWRVHPVVSIKHLIYLLCKTQISTWNVCMKCELCAPNWNSNDCTLDSTTNQIACIIKEGKICETRGESFHFYHVN